MKMRSFRDLLSRIQFATTVGGDCSSTIGLSSIWKWILLSSLSRSEDSASVAFEKGIFFSFLEIVTVVCSLFDLEDALTFVVLVVCSSFLALVETILRTFPAQAEEVFWDGSVGRDFRCGNFGCAAGPLEELWEAFSSRFDRPDGPDPWVASLFPLGSAGGKLFLRPSLGDLALVVGI